MKSMTTYRGLIIIGCFMGLWSMAMGGNEEELTFSHSSHVEDFTCDICHTEEREGTFVVPDTDTCLTCHEGNITLKRRPKRAFESFQALEFSHKKHVNHPCSTCHVLGENNQDMGIASFGTCMACHEKNEVMTVTCASCHPKRMKPGYHDGLFRKNHALIQKSPKQAVHGHDCVSCHAKPLCISCHKTMSPRSHNGFFRLRGHGLHARIDSAGCTTCHSERSCIECHKVTQPLNHNGLWSVVHGRAVAGGEGGALGSCSVCHKASWCTECHMSR